MENKIARFLSILFHPLLMPTYAMILLLNLQVYFAMVIPDSGKWRLIGMVFLLTFVFPTIMSLFFIRLKIIKSLEMRTREERVFPFIMTGLFFYLTYFLFKSLNISPVYTYFVIGATFLVVLALIINFFWKISIHMMAIGGMFGTFLGVSLVFFVSLPATIISLVAVAGLTGYARLKLDTHSPAQVYSGFLIGAIVMLGLFLLV